MFGLRVNNEVRDVGLSGLGVLLRFGVDVSPALPHYSHHVHQRSNDPEDPGSPKPTGFGFRV